MKNARSLLLEPGCGQGDEFLDPVHECGRRTVGVQRGRDAGVARADCQGGDGSHYHEVKLMQ